jgi:hypothetical protein
MESASGSLGMDHGLRRVLAFENGCCSSARACLRTHRTLPRREDHAGHVFIGEVIL